MVQCYKNVVHINSNIPVFFSRGAYQDQEETQGLSGLATAVTLKSRGVTYKVFICITQIRLSHVYSLDCWCRFAGAVCRFGTSLALSNNCLIVCSLLTDLFCSLNTVTEFNGYVVVMFLC